MILWFHLREDGLEYSINLFQQRKVHKTGLGIQIAQECQLALKKIGGLSVQRGLFTMSVNRVGRYVTMLCRAQVIDRISKASPFIQLSGISLKIHLVQIDSHYILSGY